MTTNRIARRIIAVEEGWRGRPYYCSENFPTVGFGFRIGDKGAPLPNFRLPLAAGEVWLDELIKELLHNAGHLTAGLNPVREAVMLSMAYQMGVTGLLGFKNMQSAIDRRAYWEAADHMLDSRWAKQTPARAERHAEMMRTGKLLDYYA
jgi:lysozyme